jgi:hypothetical protein
MNVAVSSRRPLDRWWSFALCAALLLALTGCSSFHRQWKAAQAAPASGLAGAWEGTWLSHSNGHTGRLRAIVRPTGSGEVEARFHATFWKLFSAEYTVTLNAAAAEGAGHWTLTGSHDVGRWLFWNFGEYQYLGAATARAFHCNYTGPMDHGVFDLKRPD